MEILGKHCLWYASLAWLAVSGLAAAEHHGQVNFNGLPVPGATVTAAAAPAAASGPSHTHKIKTAKRNEALMPVAFPSGPLRRASSTPIPNLRCGSVNQDSLGTAPP